MHQHLNKTRVFVGLLVVSLLATVGMGRAVASAQSITVQQGTFADIPDEAYYATPVKTLAGDGVFVGTECGTHMFCPSEPLLRWQMAVWIVRVLEGEEPAPIDNHRFKDVDEDDWYGPHVERMYELNVTRGCGDGTGFCPDREVTRAQMAVFLTRAFNLPVGPQPGFVDVPVDAWYADQVSALAASGITKGCGDGSGFCPSRSTTRAQMATFLHRAINRTPSVSDVDCDFSDHSDLVRSAVYQVHTSDSIGTAFYIGHDEWLTAAHVVTGERTVVLRNGTHELEAAVIGGNNSADIALLEAASPAAPLQFGKLIDTKPGDPLYVVGFPLYVASDPSVTRGILSRVEEYSDIGTTLLTDAASNPGNSGGPVVDDCGNVLGMLVAGYRDSEGVNYAIAESTLQNRLPTLRDGWTDTPTDTLQPTAQQPSGPSDWERTDHDDWFGVSTIRDVNPDQWDYDFLALSVSCHFSLGLDVYVSLSSVSHFLNPTYGFDIDYGFGAPQLATAFSDEDRLFSGSLIYMHYDNIPGVRQIVAFRHDRCALRGHLQRMGGHRPERLRLRLRGRRMGRRVGRGRRCGACVESVRFLSSGPLARRPWNLHSVVG